MFYVHKHKHKQLHAHANVCTCFTCQPGKCTTLCKNCKSLCARHVVVDWGKVLNLSETNCSLPHVLARCHIPPSIPSQFAHSPVLPHFCHFAQKPEFLDSTWCNVLKWQKSQKMQLLQMGFSCWGQFKTERNKKYDAIYSHFLLVSFNIQFYVVFPIPI